MTVLGFVADVRVPTQSHILEICFEKGAENNRTRLRTTPLHLNRDPPVDDPWFENTQALDAAAKPANLFR